MSLDQLLAQCEFERRRRGVSFSWTRTHLRSERRNLHFARRWSFWRTVTTKAAKTRRWNEAAHSELFGMSEDLIDQLIVVSDGGCCGYLRERLEAACGLDGMR